MRNKVREIRQFKCNKANPFAARLIKNKYKGGSVSLDEVLKVAFNGFNQGTCRRDASLWLLLKIFRDV